MFGKYLDSVLKTSIDTLSVYILSTILLVGVGSVLAHVLGTVGVVENVGSIFTGGAVFTMIGTGFILVLGSLIVHEKKLTTDTFSVVMLGIGVYLAYTSSIFLGLVPIALLTTLKK